MSLRDRWTRLLDNLRIAGRYRELQASSGVDFCSNDYLGYGKENPSKAGAALPCSGMASRLLRGNHPIWEHVEAELAAWHGTEACLVMNSGYCANEGVLSTLIGRQDWVASDQLNHASIIDGLRLAQAERFIYRHRDLDHLEQGLAQAARTRAADRQLFIVTESLFGMDGDTAPLSELVRLAEQYSAHLIVDEAHATGCFGDSGAGCIELAGVRRQILASIHTGGKALGVPGAYVCGSRLLRELLVNCCRHFIFTTALPPAAAVWWLDAIRRVRQDDDRRLKLHRHAESFRKALQAQGLDCGGRHYIVPVILGADEQAVSAARQLQAQGWDIRAIRPPTVPTGTARLRISIHADHDESTLAEVAAALAALIRSP
jgi:8-amino-7-oxononanoate synthase